MDEQSHHPLTDKAQKAMDEIEDKLRGMRGTTTPIAAVDKSPGTPYPERPVVTAPEQTAGEPEPPPADPDHQAQVEDRAIDSYLHRAWMRHMQRLRGFSFVIGQEDMKALREMREALMRVPPHDPVTHE